MNTTGSIRAIYTDAGRQKFEPLESDIKAFRVIYTPANYDEVVPRDTSASVKGQIGAIMRHTHSLVESNNG